jgi:anti-anti-sigma factor
MPPETEVPVAVLAPAGPLDLVTSRELGASLSELAGTAGNAVLDLSDVTVLDSVGLAVVLKAAGRFHRQDKRLVLVAPPDGPVQRTLEVSGMRGRLVVAGDRDAALALARG